MFAKDTYLLNLDMGGTFSEPVPPLVGEGYVCFIFRSYDKLRVLHANATVHELVVSLVR